MWSTVVAERLGIIGHAEAVERLTKTITTLESMERHEESGQFYNWYDHTRRREAHRLAADGRTADPGPILSSVDNGWLATGLQVVTNSVPEVSEQAAALFDSMDFGFYYRPAVNRIAFHVVPDTGESPCCYDTIVSESRIASYIGIAKGELPHQGVFRRLADLPRTPATGAGRRRSRSASRPRTWASRSSKAHTRTTTSVSCPAGAAACSKR